MYTIKELLEILSNYVEADMDGSFHAEDDLDNIQESCNYWLNHGN